MIELKHVNKTYTSGTGGGVDALKDVSLTIADGDIYGIIGMSGAGKSKLVRYLAIDGLALIIYLYQRSVLRHWTISLLDYLVLKT